MKRTKKQRILVSRAATGVAAACGVAAGYLLGCALAINLAENWLGQYTERIVAQGDASSKEAHSLLATLKKSPYPFCSEAEIAYFRELVFRSGYVKDAGRIHDGRIDCSAAAGHPARSIGQFKAQTPQQDGTIAYSNLAPLRHGGLKMAGLQQGNAYVIIVSTLPASLGPIPMRLVTGKKDSAEQAAGDAQDPPSDKTDDPEFTTDGTARVGNTLYATRCSTVDSNCVTAATTVSEAMKGELSKVVEATVLGGLAGALLGMAFSLLYHRSLNAEQQLRRAIAHDNLQVMYQPIVSLASGQIVGAEALARWTDEEGNAVSPDVFVKIAEEHGFVGGLTKLVVRRALSAFADTLRNRTGFRLSVNVAAADLADPGFLPMLDESLRQTKVQSKSLVIEITESSTANREVAMETIRSLRRRGHSIHIDDFGTGYSSLSYLLYLSVDTIKIDKAFTRAIGTESVTVAILPQILAMAESLKLEVVVEGVETDHQASYFSAVGQPIYGQGWLYGHPVTAEEFHNLLAEDRKKAPAPRDAAIAEPAGTGAVRIAGARSLRIDSRRTA